MAFNKVILIGNMANDPELRSIPSGVSTCSFSIAVNRRFAKEGEQSCDFINVVAWKTTAEFVAKHFTKGKPILVFGRLQTRNWKDKDGNNRYATEVVADEVSFVGSKENATEAKNYTPDAYKAQTQFEPVDNEQGLPF